MPSLTVLVDHMALMRESTRFPGPDPVPVAVLAELAGADGIGVYMREDRRHIQEQDLRLLRQTVRGRLIIHMAPTSEMVGIALEIKPERVIIVPELGKEGGPPEDELDLMVHGDRIFKTIDTLQFNAISVGVSISPEPEQAKMAHQIGAVWIQIHAGRLQTATTAASQTRALDKIIDTVKMAHKLRLRIAVGGGLDYRLIRLFRELPEIDEFSLGQNLITRAVLKGMEPAVQEMIGLIRTL
jgi:pyridoxine 5-phosphate synthase